MNARPAPLGFVSLVGAGPGDPELVTLRGVRRLQQADAVVHDRLVSQDLIGFCRPDVERYDVGKSPKQPGCTQDDINNLLVRLARIGRRVVRLKGGDPFVFGRGGEEALALLMAGVPFEIVPGISSGLAVPAVAGIPVTQRGIASSVTIATGHVQEGHSRGDHDWSALARLSGTLVFLMAVENLEHIAQQLLSHGRDPREPAALVQDGTTVGQVIVSAPLTDVVQVARDAGIVPPAVLVVGPSVALADEIGARFTPTGMTGLRVEGGMRGALPSTLSFSH